MYENFLAGLPAPRIIEPLSYEAILAAYRADLIARLPEIAPILALESSAANKVMQVAAYREFVLRARVNDAAASNLLSMAAGSDLDHVGANASPAVSRMVGEGDERFRLRILLATMARNVGSEPFYRKVALDTDLMVRDAIAYRLGRDPRVYVALLSNEPGGIAAPWLINAVALNLSAAENRLVNSEVTVRSAVTSVVAISAALVVLPGAPIAILAQAEAALRAAWLAEGGLGRDLTRDWIKARLAVPGIYSVSLSAPTADHLVPPYSAVSIGTVSLTIAGEDG